MTRVLLTIACADVDAMAIARALRETLAVPVHHRAEAVLGRDFDDAAVVERVAGRLARVALDVEVEADRVQEAIVVARGARRRLPFRWRTVAILDGGRVE